jgi:hypothetical protein
MLAKRLAVLSLVMGLAIAPAAAQQPPDPATHPNVKDVEISGTDKNSLDVAKNNDAKVKEIWKYDADTAQFVKVWDLDNGGDFLITKNDTTKTHITNSPATDEFNQGDKFRIVCEATDTHGNSTVINSITQNKTP